MELVIFSDIHGNADAFRKMLERENQRSGRLFIFCGDLAGYYYDFEECAELLTGLDRLISVRGNHDQYYIDSFSDKDMTDRLAGQYGSSYRIKSIKVLEYLKSMSCCVRIKPEHGMAMAIQHGAPYNLLEGRIYPDTSVKSVKNMRDNTIIICGHTHYQLYRKDKGHIWINPGSLGQPRDGKGFSYCVYDTDNRQADFRKVEIDMEALTDRIKADDPDHKYLAEVLQRKNGI